MGERAMQPLRADDPRMIAWNAYRESDDFQNTKRWATQPDHTEGSLWAAFLRGWEACARAGGAGGSMSVKPTVEAGLERALTTEIVASAYRAVDEAVKLSPRPTHDGTRCVLIPEGIFNRLRRAVELHGDVVGRPKGVRRG